MADLRVVQGWPVVANPVLDVLDTPQLTHGYLVVRLREVRPARELVDALTGNAQAVFDLARTHEVATHKQDHRHDTTRHLYNGQRPASNVHVPSQHLPRYPGRQLNREEVAEVADIKRRGVCALCRLGGQRLVYEHDHDIGNHGGRGMTCQSCNAGHMTGIDQGRYAIDPVTRMYLIEPWHLARLGKRLHYDPVIHVSVADLNLADRRELNRLSWEFISCGFSMRSAQPQFTHPEIANLVALGEVRCVLRLRVLNIRGLHDLDIAETGDRMSAFQRDRLPQILAQRPVDEWAAIAADAA